MAYGERLEAFVFAAVILVGMPAAILASKLIAG